MSVSVEWGNEEQTFVIWRFGEAWTVNQFRRQVDQTIDMIEGKHSVDFIVDLRFAGVPADLLEAARYYAAHRAPNTGMTVIVTDNAVWQRVAQMADEAIPSPILSDVHFVDTFEDAYALLETRQQL